MGVRSLATSELIRWLRPTVREGARRLVPLGSLADPRQIAPDALRARSVLAIPDIK